MADTSVIKVSAQASPKGEMGQKYLATGISVSMRLWEAEPPGALGPRVRRDYETVGYVIRGKCELHLEGGQLVILNPGDSWVVPRGEEHAYRVVETFTAVEATHPPAHIHGRDERANRTARA